MKKLLLLFVFVGLYFPALKAQDWLDRYPTQNAFGHRKLSLDQIQGSPYLDKVFRSGKVITDDGLLYKDIPLRYNCFSDVFEFEKGGNPFELMPKEKVSRAEFGGQIFRFMSFEPTGGVSKGYFMILAEGRATLCARYTINFYEEEPAQGYADPQKARFADLSETFWISVNDAPAKKITNNKKLVEILADKGKEVQNFMSKNKLAIKKSEDLKKIINYYNLQEK